MTAVIIPPLHGEAILIWDVELRRLPITCTLGYRTTVGHFPHEVANLIQDAFTQSGSLCFPSAMRTMFTFKDVKCIQNDAGTIVEGLSDGGDVVGTHTSGDPEIISSTLLIQKRTGRVGRKFRGRMYFPFMEGAESQVDYMGNIDGTVLGIINARVGVAFDALTADPTLCTPVLLHTDSTTPTELTGFQAVGRTATQRRRLR